MTPEINNNKRNLINLDTIFQIANLIRDNKSSKDIAEILHMSVNTVFFYRKNIRDKFGLRNNKTNLMSYLQSLSRE